MNRKSLAAAFGGVSPMVRTLVAIATLTTAACSTAAPQPSSVAESPSAAPAPNAPGPSAPPTSTSAPPTLDPTPGPTPSPTADPLADRTQAELSMDGGPDWPIAAFGSMWLLTPDADEPSITRLDPTTNEVIATIPVGTRLCQAMGASEDAIWACTRNGVVRVDPETNEIVATIEVPTAEYFGYLPFGDGSLWVPSGEVARTDQLVRIDPDTNEIIDTVDLGFDASDVSYGADALWLSDMAGGKLWRFDPATDELTEHVSDVPEPGYSAVGAGSVWLAIRAIRERPSSTTELTVLRIDPDSGDIEAEIATGSQVFEGMIYADDETVWVRSAVLFLSRIDPHTNTVVDTVDINRAGGSVTIAYDSLWVTATEFGRVWRLTP